MSVFRILCVDIFNRLSGSLVQEHSFTTWDEVRGVD